MGLEKGLLRAEDAAWNLYYAPTVPEDDAWWIWVRMAAGGVTFASFDVYCDPVVGYRDYEDAVAIEGWAVDSPRAWALLGAGERQDLLLWPAGLARSQGPDALPRGLADTTPLWHIAQGERTWEWEAGLPWLDGSTGEIVAP